MSSLKDDKIIQSNCNDIKRKKIEILDRRKVWGFLSTRKPVGNCLEGMLFRVRILLVSFYISLRHVIQVFWIRGCWSTRKLLVIQHDNSYDSEIYKCIDILLILKYSYKVQLSKGFKNRT